LRAAYAFGAAHGLEPEVTDIREMVIERDSSKHVFTASWLHCSAERRFGQRIDADHRGDDLRDPRKKNSSPMPGGHDHGGMDF